MTKKEGGATEPEAHVDDVPAVDPIEEEKRKQAHRAAHECSVRLRLEAPDFDGPCTPQYRYWRDYEITRRAIHDARQAGVDEEDLVLGALLGRLRDELELVNQVRSRPGTSAKPASDHTAHGTLVDDDKALEAFWHSTGGPEGHWKSMTGWDTVGKWLEMCESWEPPAAKVQPPWKEVPKPSIGQIVKAAVPPSYGVLVHRARVQKLQIIDNGLHGPLPQNFGLLTNLRILVLFGNELTGFIPESIAHCRLLQHIDLSSNQLSGGFPRELAALKCLRELHLEKNQLSGTLPMSMGGLTSLVELTAHHNKISGEIPCDIGECSKLELLSLHNNLLRGLVPDSISQCKLLKKLLLCKNRLVGGVPADISGSCDIPMTPRTGMQLSVQVFPSLTPAELGEMDLPEALDGLGPDTTQEEEEEAGEEQQAGEGHDARADGAVAGADVDAYGYSGQEGSWDQQGGYWDGQGDYYGNQDGNYDGQAGWSEQGAYQDGTWDRNGQ